MSREVRRVPLGWKHPTEPNPYWLEQAASRLHRNRNLSQLHMPQERFVGLVDDLPEAQLNWAGELSEIKERRGHSWDFGVEYHLTGYQGHADDEAVVHPFHQWTDDGMETFAVDVRDEDHLQELLLAQTVKEQPDPEDYMPVWSEDVATGWCLYETVSEGTPVTPVFATSWDLIRHLATVGQDWDQVPMRESAARALVESGSSFGTLLVVGNQVLDGAKDADVIAGMSAS